MCVSCHVVLDFLGVNLEQIVSKTCRWTFRHIYFTNTFILQSYTPFVYCVVNIVHTISFCVSLSSYFSNHPCSRSLHPPTCFSTAWRDPRCNQETLEIVGVVIINSTRRRSFPTTTNIYLPNSPSNITFGFAHRSMSPSAFSINGYKAVRHCSFPRDR